jgi:hypothetical protein
VWLDDNDRTHAGQEFFDNLEPLRNNELPEDEFRRGVVIAIDYQHGIFVDCMLKLDESSRFSMLLSLPRKAVDFAPIGAHRADSLLVRRRLASRCMVRATSRANKRRVAGMTDGGITETTRRILLPTKASPNWKCSDCAWSQPFVQRLELEPNVPTQAIEDAFHRHKCTEHRHSKWAR